MARVYVEPDERVEITRRYVESLSDAGPVTVRECPGEKFRIIYDTGPSSAVCWGDFEPRHSRLWVPDYEQAFHEQSMAGAIRTCARLHGVTLMSIRIRQEARSKRGRR